MACAMGQEKAGPRIERLKMDFGEIFRILLRRWRVSVPVLMLTIAATLGMWHAWPTSYQSNTTITLLGSKDLATAQGNGNNRYLVVGDLEPLANILAANLSTQQAANQLQALGVSGSFTAVVPAFAAGPFITLTLEGSNRAAIIQSMPVTISFAQQQLRELQVNGSINTPTSGIVGATVIAEPSIPAPVYKKKIEVVAGVAIFGLLSLFLLSFAAEAWAVRRRKSTMWDARRRKSTAVGGARRALRGTSPAAPSGVSPAPDVTSPAPAGLDPAPGSTSPVPSAISPVPTSTSPVPSSISPAAPSAVSPALSSTSPAPSSTSPALSATSPAPGGVNQVSIGKPQQVSIGKPQPASQGSMQEEGKGLPQQNRQSVRVQ